MSRDLISRSALMAELRKNTLIRDFNFEYDGILGEIINSIPAVKPDCLSCDPYHDGFHDGYDTCEKNICSNKAGEVNDRET